jgi:hypothetical protein
LALGVSTDDFSFPLPPIAEVINTLIGFSLIEFRSELLSLWPSLFHSINLLDNLFLVLSTRPIFILKTVTFNIWLPCMWWSSWSYILNMIQSEIWRSMCRWIAPPPWWIRMSISGIWSIWNRHRWLKRRICLSLNENPFFVDSNSHNYV